MAPTRNSKSVNKRISNLNEVSPGKDGVNLNKNKPRVCFCLVCFVHRSHTASANTSVSWLISYFARTVIN